MEPAPRSFERRPASAAPAPSGSNKGASAVVIHCMAGARRARPRKPLLWHEQDGLSLAEVKSMAAPIEVTIEYCTS